MILRKQSFVFCVLVVHRVIICNFIKSHTITAQSAMVCWYSP
jgi:hypothetical protein